MRIIGRIREQAELKRYFESGRPEFIAVVGRRHEFYEVYRSLFRASDRHISIVSVLSKRRSGMTRDVNGNNSKGEYFWTNQLGGGERNAWNGHAFEQLCLLHVAQIKRKLGISGISTEVFSWKSREHSPGAQIDLLIKRRDGVINLCETKYSVHPFTISRQYDQVLQRKRMIFLAETKARNAIHLTMITTYGLTSNGYRASIQSEVTLDDLFTIE